MQYIARCLANAQTVGCWRTVCQERNAGNQRGNYLEKQLHSVYLAQNYEEIARDLRDRIIRGEIVPGQRLIEREIASWYAISRTPAREALKQLASDGLVVLTPNRGAEVARFGGQDALNLFRVLAELESLAARSFAENMTTSLLAELESRHALTARHFERRELDSYFFANSAVHELLVTECGNDILVDTHARLMMRARVGRHRALLSERRWSDAMDEHEQMMAALRRHDPNAVAGIWRRHLLNSGRALAEQVTT